MRPHIPSDSIPSSSSSPYSSVSPRRQHDHLHTPPLPAERYIAQLREDGTFGATSDYPILLDSDDEDAIIIAVSVEVMSIILIAIIGLIVAQSLIAALTVANLIEPTESGITFVL